MLMLLLQTFLILLAAFLTGAALACLLKRMILGEPIPVAVPVRETASVPVRTAVAEGIAAPKAILPETKVPDGGGTDRFGRALSGTPGIAPAAPAKPTAPVVEVQPPAPRPAPPPAPVVTAPAPVAEKPAPAPVAAPVVQAVAPPPPPPPPAPVLTPKPAPAPIVAATAVAAAVPAAFTSLAMDDLTRIKGIDPVVQSRLNALGVRRYWQIAGWDADEVSRTSQSLGFAGRINDEKWIEQAAILSSGAETHYAERRRLGLPEPEEAAAAEAAKAADAAKAEEAAKVAGAARVAEIAKAAEAARLADAAKAAEAAEATKATDAAASTASAAAIAAATSIAAAGAAAAAASMPAAKPGIVEPAAGTASPVQIAETVKAEDTQMSPAAEPNRDLTHLRSVRSEALRGEPLAPSNRASGAFDDLKRIRGVGVLIEKKLNSLAVTTYEQVANWTSADIDRVSQLLDFKGRIERENWVEQARILASGGQTEFSRRVDRGEVETSR